MQNFCCHQTEKTTVLCFLTSSWTRFHCLSREAKSSDCCFDRYKSRARSSRSSCVTQCGSLPLASECVACFIKAHVFRFVCIDMEANACGGSFQTMQKGFGLGGCICQKRYVIGVVGVGYCFCGIPSTSFLCQLETVFFDFFNRCTKHMV